MNMLSSYHTCEGHSTIWSYLLWLSTASRYVYTSSCDQDTGARDYSGIKGNYLRFFKVSWAPRDRDNKLCAPFAAIFWQGGRLWKCDTKSRGRANWSTAVRLAWRAINDLNGWFSHPSDPNIRLVCRKIPSSKINDMIWATIIWTTYDTKILQARHVFVWQTESTTLFSLDLT